MMPLALVQQIRTPDARTAIAITFGLPLADI